MLNNSNLLILVFCIVNTVWIFLLTILFIKIKKTFDRLGKTDENSNLSKTLEKILEKNGEEETRIKDLEKTHTETLKKDRLHLQKVGLIRFNPFNDTGGDQSFVLSLLDGDDSGVVISVLHGRGGARIYSKSVKNGKALEHELSEEEIKAIEKAKTSTSQPA